MPNRYVKRRNRFGQKGGRLRKRWYLNAGATLPFVGKTTLSMGSSKFKRSVAAIVRRQEDPLHKLWSKVGTAQPSQSMTHLTMYTVNLTGNIPQGTNDNSRQGDTIHLEAIKFKLLFDTVTSTNKAAQKQYRVMIVKHDAEYLGGSDSFGSGLGATEIFHGNNAPAYEQINSKLCTVLYDKLITVTPQISANNYLSCLSEIIRFNSPFIYKTGTNFGKMFNYYLVVTGFESNATGGVTNVGTVSFFGDLIFKEGK